MLEESKAPCVAKLQLVQCIKDGTMNIDKHVMLIFYSQCMHQTTFNKIKCLFK